jgi:clavulanate-9-aldehyde reducatase
VVAARRIDRLEALRERLVDKGAKVLAVALDVVDERSCTDSVARAVDHFGGLDLLVNNAGVLLVGSADAATPVEDFRALDAQLTELGKDHEMYVYEGAPHSYFDRAFGEWKQACEDS